MIYTRQQQQQKVHCFWGRHNMPPLRVSRIATELFVAKICRGFVWGLCCQVVRCFKSSGALPESWFTPVCSSGQGKAQQTSAMFFFAFVFTCELVEKGPSCVAAATAWKQAERSNFGQVVRVCLLCVYVHMQGAVQVLPKGSHLTERGCTTPQVECNSSSPQKCHCTHTTCITPSGAVCLE